MNSNLTKKTNSRSKSGGGVGKGGKGAAATSGISIVSKHKPAPSCLIPIKNNTSSSTMVKQKETLLKGRQKDPQAFENSTRDNTNEDDDL